MSRRTTLVLVALAAAWPLGSSKADEKSLDVNDVSILWPIPETEHDVDNLISADAELASGGILWPRSAFNAVLEAARTISFPRQPGLDPFTIRFPSKIRELHAWKVAGIRFDASAPGSHSDLVLKFGSTPQIRIILQPVTRDDVTVHDFTAHLVFDYTAPPDPIAPHKGVPDRHAFGEILNDLREIKKAVETSGVSTKGPLGVHPGLAQDVDGIRDKIGILLKRRLSEGRLRAVSFMGIDGREPWIFFAMSRSRENGTMTLAAPPSIRPAVAQMLSFRSIDRVVPSPNLLEHKVATAMLFDAGIRTRLDERIDADVKARFRDVPAIIANPQLAHFFNTDCVSCHSESTRRSDLGINDDSSFRFHFPDGVSNVDQSLLPTDSWNVRNFGWGVDRSREIVATVSQRCANEAAESVAFINEHFSNDEDSNRESSTETRVDAQPETGSESVAHALTLVMTAKSEEDYTKLKALVKALQNNPENPIKKALDEIGVVHDARFVFFDEQRQLAVITTFDDDFDVYLDLFISEIGHVFDLVLQHVKDAPPLPVADHADEFHEYVRVNNRELEGPFYSAYPDLRVSDILRMQRDAAATMNSGGATADLP